MTTTTPKMPVTYRKEPSRNGAKEAMSAPAMICTTLSALNQR